MAWNRNTMTFQDMVNRNRITEDMTDRDVEYLPTEEEIRKACSEIQKEWTREQEQKRRCIKNQEVNWSYPNTTSGIVYAPVKSILDII